MCGLPPGRAGRAPQPSRHTRPVAAVTGRGATSGTCCGGGLPVATGLGVAGDPVLDVGAGTDRAAHPAAVTATPATPASRSSRRRVKASPDRSVGDAPMNVTIRRFGREQRNRGENTFALASVAMPLARREIFKYALTLAAGTTLAATAERRAGAAEASGYSTSPPCRCNPSRSRQPATTGRWSTYPNYGPVRTSIPHPRC